MILIDLNQVMLSNLLSNLENHTNTKIEENMVRHMILNSIRAYKLKFSSEYGEIIIACDNNNYWRKKFFPYYKANIKKIQEQSDLNWQDIFNFLNKITAELKEFFPYKIIDVETAEADDVIASLIHELNTKEKKILILSGDKDFIQLQCYINVKQYDPVKKKWIEHENPSTYLLEHILKGDPGDNIPNILSQDDCFVTNTRQKHLTKKRIETFKKNPSLLKNTYYERNKKLIDLFVSVPPEVEKNIIEQYYSQKTKDRSKLMNYFISHGVKNLLEHLSEF